MGISPEALVEQVQVNVPFPFLLQGYLERFLKRGLNPEIGLDAGSLGTYPPGTFRRVARIFAGAGRRCTVHGPFQDLSPGALDDLILAATRRRLRQAWRWLPVFRPAAVICHLGYEDRHFSWNRENWLNRAAATYRELGTQAARHGVRVMLENVYERDPELIREAIQRIDLANVRVCLDVGHLLAFGGGDFQGWLDTLGPIIGHLHLHDNLGVHGRPPGPGHRQRPPGICPHPPGRKRPTPPYHPGTPPGRQPHPFPGVPRQNLALG